MTSTLSSPAPTAGMPKQTSSVFLTDLEGLLREALTRLQDQHLDTERMRVGIVGAIEVLQKALMQG